MKNLSSSSNPKDLLIIKEEKAKLQKEENRLRKLKEIYLKKYRDKLEKNYEKQEKLLEYEYFNRTDLLGVITYLVSRIEESIYELCYYPLTMHHEKEYQDGDISNSLVNYIMVYLAKPENKEDSIKEIKERFTYIPYANLIHENSVSDNYLQLAFYKPNDINLLRFTDTASAPINISPKSVKQHSYIYDEHFNYVIDFINLLIDYRFHNENSDIKVEEMFVLANQFIDNYKKVKSETESIKLEKK